MNFKSQLLVFITIFSLFVCTEMSTCVPWTTLVCECCGPETTCIKVPDHVILTLTPIYICIPKALSTNFSFNDCVCKLNMPSVCACDNYSRLFAIHSECDTFAECAIATIEIEAQEKIRKILCKQISKTGRCSKRYMYRFYFDQQTNQCKEFIYTGCGVNRHVFLDRELCEKTCRI